MNEVRSLRQETAIENFIQLIYLQNYEYNQTRNLLSFALDCLKNNVNVKYTFFSKIRYGKIKSLLL